MRAPAEWGGFQSVSAIALLLMLGAGPARGEDVETPSAGTPGIALFEWLGGGHPAAVHAEESGAGAPALPRLAMAGASPDQALLRGDSVDLPDNSEAGADLDPKSPPPPTGMEGDQRGAPPARAAAPPQSGASDGEASTQPALAPVNAALKAALEARAAPEFRGPRVALDRREREAVAAFYASRDFAPLWSSNGKLNPEVETVFARLQRAADDGLDLKRSPRLPAPSGSNEDIASADIAFSEAVVAYGREASGSRVDPHAISPLIGARPEVADASVILANVATAGEDAGDVLWAFNPQQAGYVALRGKLAELRREHAPSARAPSIPDGPTLKVGMSDPRVPLIRARLSLDGQKAEAVQNLVYDTRVASAVADFQKANGLPASGRLTARTISILSGGRPSRLEAEIVANMERWRWMPRDMGSSRIEVNIPDFEVVVVENGRIVERNRVVVGKEQTPTPIFSNQMRFLIVNPSWNVPQSIIRKEMLPKLGADPGYLRRLGYQVAYIGGRLTVRQPPGERNALGRIKFMFPNDYAVYLHDTPSRALFSESRRAFSHGCVRVDDPFAFAETVLGRDHGWSEQRVKGLIGGKERYVYLPKPLPVHIEYFTTFVDESGRLQLRDDIYGYSRRVKEALGLTS